MPTAFIRKLEGSGPLPLSDTAFLREACSIAREVPARYDLIRDGDPPGPLFIMIEGWSCRYKLLPEGSRQITAFLMPGDCCDLYASLLVEMDHSIITLTPARVAAVPRHAFEVEILRRPRCCARSGTCNSSTKARCAPGSLAWVGAAAYSASRT